MKQVYCICCAGAMFFCLFSLSMVQRAARHSAAENRILRCGCVSFRFSPARFSAQIFFAGQKSLGLFFILTQIADIIKLYSIVYIMAQRHTRRRAKFLRCRQKNKTAAANSFFAAANRNGFRLIFYNSYILFVFSRKEFF